jgi:hypothetical protein
MRLSRYHTSAIVLAVALLAAPAALATTVMQLNLAQLVGRADRIYRGTVLTATEGTLAVGGGQLPIVTYQIRVDEAFRGGTTVVKGVRVAEIRMLGKFARVKSGSIRRVSVFPEMPQLRVGQTYLLFATRPSAIGLSTTVGLSQGWFLISGQGKDEVAVNGASNSGLFRDMAPPAPRAGARIAAAPAAEGRGAIAYADLAREVRALMAGGRR